jgi:hypothetical protein
MHLHYHDAYKNPLYLYKHFKSGKYNKQCIIWFGRGKKVDANL